MSKWLKKGDKVKIIAGNDKGKVGEILSRSEDRVIINGINVRKKHLKSGSQVQKSNIVNIERPIHISNVVLVGDDAEKIKLKVKVQKDKKKLFYLKNGKEVVFREIKKVK